LDYYGQLDAPPELTNVVAIALGGIHALALTRDSTVIGWGDGDDGQTNVPVSLTNAVAIAAGGFHSLALTSDGLVVGWGDNYFGQTNARPGRFSAVAAGDFHSMALATNGTVVAWGDDGNGQCDTPPDLTNVIAIAAGPTYSLAIQRGGTLTGWGDDYAYPPPPPGLSNVVSAAAGSLHILALKSDGSVTAWGRDSMGETLVPSGLRNVISVAVGGSEGSGPISFALVGEPELTISQSSSNALTVSWPSWVTGAVLEQSSNLTDGAWSTVTNVPLVGDGQFSVLLTNTIGSSFFRLRQ
jgi:alpha-tubulin suppressor-like RCC1 family protein